MNPAHDLMLESILRLCEEAWGQDEWTHAAWFAAFVLEAMTAGDLS